jgi:hypothetical protein
MLSKILLEPPTACTMKLRQVAVPFTLQASRPTLLLLRLTNLAKKARLSVRLMQHSLARCRSLTTVLCWIFLQHSLEQHLVMRALS